MHLIAEQAGHELMTDRVSVSDPHEELLVSGDDGLELAEPGLGHGADIAAIRKLEFTVSRRDVQQPARVGCDGAAEVADPVGEPLRRRSGVVGDLCQLVG